MNRVGTYLAACVVCLFVALYDACRYAEIGKVLGSCVGKSEKAFVGAELGMLLGLVVGDSLPICVGECEKTLLGEELGTELGSTDGTALGAKLVTLLGSVVSDALPSVGAVVMGC